jgi:hypothetical protein
MFDDGFIFYQYILKINIKKYKMIEKLRLLLMGIGDWDWGFGSIYLFPEISLINLAV